MIQPERSIEVLHEHDLVALLVVDQLVDERARDGEAQAARAEALLLPDEGVLQRVVVGVVDRRVRQAIAALPDERMRERRTFNIVAFYTYLACEEHLEELGVRV